VKMPNTAHADLAGIRVEGSCPVVFLPTPGMVAAYRSDPEIVVTAPIDRIVLERRKCAGPAPFVGDPIWEQAVYTWPVWVDGDYWIAGDAELVIAPRVVPAR